MDPVEVSGHFRHGHEQERGAFFVVRFDAFFGLLAVDRFLVACLLCASRRR